MNKLFLWAVLGIIIIGGGYWYVQNGPKNSARVAATDEANTSGMGSYPYQCEGGVEFTMTPSSDLSTITLAPGAHAEFKETVLAFTDASAGQRFEGDGLVFVGAGENVSLSMPGGAPRSATRSRTPTWLPGTGETRVRVAG